MFGLTVRIPITVLIFILTDWCSAEIIVRTTTSETNKVVDATVQILSSCYEKKGTIGIIGELPDIFLTTLNSHQLLPVVLIHHDESVGQVHRLRPLETKKLQVFVIVASDHVIFMNRIAHLMNSPWYNVMASFLVVDFSPQMDTSVTDELVGRRIKTILYVGWKMFGIYNTNVINRRPISGIMGIYNFNPHKNKAPDSWILSSITRTGAKTSFYTFGRYYREGPDMCSNLDFDKTTDLGGDAIITYIWNLHSVPKTAAIKKTASKRATIKKRNWSHSVMKRAAIESSNSERPFVQPHMLEGENVKFSIARTVNVFATFSRRMNATVRYRRWDSSREAMEGIMIYRTYYGDHIDQPQTYQCGQDGQLIMTQFRGYKSQLSKILGVIDLYSQIGTILVLIITVVILKLMMRQDLIPAILNVVRIICDTGFENLPETVSTRVYVGCLLFFAVTINGILTGNLASLLTIDIPVRHPKTMQDLVDLDYTVHTTRANAPYFEEFINSGLRIKLDDYMECSKILRVDIQAACVNADWFLKDESAHYGFYISSEPLIKHYYGFMTGIDWPYLNRLDKIFMMMESADIRDPLHIRVKVIRLIEAQIEKMNTDPEPKVMTFTNLRFAFVILGIGLTFATVSFIVELFIHRYR